MADYLPPPIRSSASWLRLAVLLALVAATGLLLGLASGPTLRRYEQRPRQVLDIILCGDVLYRAGEFVQQQSRENAAVVWYAGYLLNQRGMGIWERQALGPAPDPAALLRMGIVYSRTGYLKQGQEALQAAGAADPDHYALYLGLIELYAGEKTVREKLPVPSQLAGQPAWLGELVAADLASRRGTPQEAEAAQARWQAHLNRFGLVLVVLEIVVGGLVLGGAAVFLLGLIRRVLTLGPRRWRAPLRVPWGLWEATEVIAVMVFLMVAVSVGRSLLPWGRAAAGPLPALIMLVAYLLYMGPAVLMAWRRAGVSAQAGRLLGLRPLAAGATVWSALRVYALMLFLLAPLGLYVSYSYLASASVFLRGHDTPAAYALYFVLVCVIAPVVEEIIFRGFLYGGLRRLFSPGWAAMVSALAFTGAHLPTPSAAALLVVALGFALGLLYENTRSIIPCILVHVLHNTLVFTLMYAVMAL